MTKFAEREDVEDAAEGWTDAVVACRIYGHAWRSLTVSHALGTYTVRQRCTRCRNERQQEMDERGHASPWRMIYREGYLLTGLGRVGQDGRAALRLASIRHMQVLEVQE